MDSYLLVHYGGICILGSETEGRMKTRGKVHNSHFSGKVFWSFHTTLPLTSHQTASPGYMELQGCQGNSILYCVVVFPTKILSPWKKRRAAPKGHTTISATSLEVRNLDRKQFENEKRKKVQEFSLLHLSEIILGSGEQSFFRFLQPIKLTWSHLIIG